MIYVIGSGLSGVSCAQKLLSKGARVTILDVGLRLEGEREKIVRLVREEDRSAWSAELLSRYKSDFLVRGKGVKYKPAYGSLFPYRDISPFQTICRNITAGLSYARGGLSNVWGASVSTYLPGDFKNWPISSADLTPYYRDVFLSLPIANSPTLSVIPEGFSPSPSGELKMSTQLQLLSNRFQKMCAASGETAVGFGGPRLALRTCANHENKAACLYCGLCMYGCPYSLIYNSSAALVDFEKNEKFAYIPNIFIEKLRESGGEVQVCARDLTTGRARMFLAEKVYLGSGVFPSASILLRSYEAYEQPIFCLDSAYFMLPMLSSWAAKGVMSEDLHTLAQLCLRLQGSPSGNSSFLQVYGYNDLYQRTLQFWTGPFHPLLKGFFKILLERLFLVQGFFHSDDSPRIKITLRRNPTGEGVLLLEGINNPSSSAARRGVLKELFRVGRKLNVFPIIPMIDVGAPGRGYHSGGTFPMRLQPSYGESDLLGRPHGFSHVYLVDASVFPTIPAGPIAINVMANAARIADQSA